MAIKAKISTIGFDRAFETIRRAGGSIEAAADRALLAGARVLFVEMKSLVPVDTHNLEEHIEIGDVDVNGTFRAVEVGLVNADAETARYGAVQEYGSSSVAPQSYIRAAVDGAGKAARRAMAESLKKDGAI